MHLFFLAPPKILSLSVEGSEESGYRALCVVQGSPLPDVQWIGPEELLEGLAISPLAQGSAVAQHRTVSQLQDVLPGQQYTCSASNPLGKEQATLYVLPPKPGEPTSGETSPTLLFLISVSLGAKLLLLLGVGVWMVKGRAQLGFPCRWK